MAEDASERAYDQVLDHVRLSNDAYKPHTDKYYSERMRQFAREDKVRLGTGIWRFESWEDSYGVRERESLA